MSAFLLHLLASFQLVGMPAGAAQADRIAQATPASTVFQAATEAASNKLFTLQNAERSLSRNKQSLRSTYNKQLSEVDRLKRSRASWRRDRQLREQKARSQKTASVLQAVDRQLRSKKVAIAQMRKVLRQAIARELGQSSSAFRRSQLSKKLATLGGKPKSAPRKITMPDLELDELADAQELLTQIKMIERAEAKLAKEERSLGRRADHYAHMDVLRQKRQRSGELGAFDDTGVRRSIGRIGDGSRKSESESDSFEGAGGAVPDPGTSDQSPPLAGEPVGDFATASVVLSDVVDSSTQTALRQAQRSTSPRTKATAAKRARTQVTSQLGALRAGKARILRRLRRLQGN